MACYGTETGLTKHGDPQYRYNQLVQRYTNCTTLIGNLEVVFLEGHVEYDLSFLSTIREVSGYVLIAGNIVESIPLTGLQIIRGDTLFKHDNSEFSLFVALNYEDGVGTTRGLKELGMTGLLEILRGTVYFQDNKHLCYENTIDWLDVNPFSKPPVIFKVAQQNDKDPCGECHESCYNNITGKRHCWGKGPNKCQKLSFNVCHGNCGKGRCYGSQANQCCAPQCAGGCTGERDTDCIRCRRFDNGGQCVDSCPPMSIYDQTEMVQKDNPNFKYTFGPNCVKKCPKHLLQDRGFCVRECPAGKDAKDGRDCKPCNGPCPKKCNGTKRDEWVTSQSLKDFEACTRIEGNLEILKPTFDGDPHFNSEPLEPKDLYVLKDVREITGYLLIQSQHEAFTNLSFLSSLEIIHGRQLMKGRALSVVSTPLESLELTSLKSVRNGGVNFMFNNNLCYVEHVNWSSIVASPSKEKIQLVNNKDQAACETIGEVCDPQCDKNGCWGRGPNKCLRCSKYVFEQESLCLDNCRAYRGFPRLYHKGQGQGKCERCHEECADTCRGPNNNQCDKCRHVTIRNKENDTCEASCGPTMFPDENKICKACHPNCGSNGCTGPNKFVGRNGCKACVIGQRDEIGGMVICTDPDKQSCDKGYYSSFYTDIDSQKTTPFRICAKCDHLCLACTNSGTQIQSCPECRYFQHEGHCVRTCPGHFFGVKEKKRCESCHSECRGPCHGLASTDCKACSNFKVAINMDNNTFNCSPVCPEALHYVVKDNTTDMRNLCADEKHPEVQAMMAKNAKADKERLTIILISVAGSIVLIILITIMCYLRHKRAQNELKAAAYTAKITGVEESEPLTPTNAKPDLAKMRIINESELRIGAMIGSGAFGSVYKGLWVPQGEHVKIPVAIKVLQEGTNSSDQSAELLEEARVMSSVEHVCCVRILAVCMTSQMMLVTQLMPFGNLLKYVRENHQHIGSKALLNWCTQIARGMSYLEERGIVHRDLAARNVLVQSPNQVKITDFGLAKLLDTDSSEYRSPGGLMPIKWLALECINDKVFTHKSDVWSFGITVWELFTLGKKPYENVRTQDVPILLEKGERLQQPLICTIDVYMIMVKCWMLEPDSRPSFKELVEEFSKFSRDPGRYLVISGDNSRQLPDPEHQELSPEANLLEVEVHALASTSGPVAMEAGGATVPEGDALMRLPSASYDQQEFLHGITTDAGEDTSNLVEADDYLHPGDSSGGGRGRRAGSGQHLHLNGAANHHPHYPHHPHHHHNHHFMNGVPAGRMSPPRRQHSSTSTSSTSQFIQDPHSPLPNGGMNGTGGKSKTRRDGQKGPNKKYMHLNAAARAKQDRENPHIGGGRLDSPSSRYCSDPIKFTKDREDIEWGSQLSPYPYPGGDFSNHPRMPKKNSPSLVLPVDKDDYLQPGAAAQSLSYLDLDGKGYYQNEKPSHPGKSTNSPGLVDPGDTTTGEDDPMLDTSTTPLHINNIHHHNHNNNNNKSRGQYTNQASKSSDVFAWPPPVSPSGPHFAVDNPDYFEDEFQASVANGDAVDDELDDDVWEVQEPVPNGAWKGYIPVANTCNSPSHAAHPVNTKVMYNGGRSLRNSESNV